VGQGEAAEAATRVRTRQTGVGGEFLPPPQRQRDTPELEERDLVRARAGCTPAQASLVEAPAPGKVGDTQGHQAQALLHDVPLRKMPARILAWHRLASLPPLPGGAAMWPVAGAKGRRASERTCRPSPGGCRPAP
jgi:hypothetical protein